MGIIETHDLWKTYVMGTEEIHALRGVYIGIEKGEYVAIMGPSGSGKSTLMNLIGCLDTPSKGSYLLNGKQVSQMNDNELARIRNEEVGFVFQTFNLLPRATSLKNVELPLVYAGVSARDREQRARMALEQVDLCVAIAPYPCDLHGPEVMACVGSAHPGLQCRLVLGDWREVTKQVLGRDVDLGVADLTPAAGYARLDTELVGQHALHFYCRSGHPILGRGELTLVDLADTVLVGTRASVRLSAALVKLGGRAGALDKTTGDFVPAWEVNTIHATKDMVASSDAIGAAMLTQIRHELDTGELCLLRIHTP